MALLCGTKAAWVNQADKIIAMLDKDREIMLADRIGQPLGEEQKNAGVVVEGLIEGDIAPDGGNLDAQILKKDDYGPPLNLDRNAIKDYWGRWPGGRIPYQISANYNNKERDVIGKAIEVYHKNTCIRFVPKKKTDKYFIHIFKGSGCYAYVGKIDKAEQEAGQPVSIGRYCVGEGTIIHELMHTLGFWHEQSRIDRDAHIIVHYKNIMKGYESQFNKYESHEASDLRAPYDRCSIMHYGERAFGRVVGGKKLITIEVRKNSTEKCRIGNRETFSDMDIRKLNTLYKCRGYPQTDGGESSECKDRFDSCEEGDCNDDFLKGHCDKTCGICDAHEALKHCIDEEQSCQVSAEACAEVSKQKSCCASCKQFTTPKPSTSTKKPETIGADCFDFREDCSETASLDLCNTDNAFKSNCCQSCFNLKLKATTTQKPTTTTVKTTTTPKQSKICMDYNDNCAYWAKIGHCKKGQYVQYMKDKCPKSCKYCECKDKKSEADCKNLASRRGKCEKDPETRTNCCKTCNTCMDYKDECAGWAKNDVCTDKNFEGYMKDKCPKSCHYC